MGKAGRYAAIQRRQARHGLRGDGRCVVRRRAVPLEWRRAPWCLDCAEGRGEAAPHPTTKPWRLMSQLVECFSSAGEIVFDPFMGSGSTGVAATRLGRRFIGVEIHEPYFDTACRRIEESQRQGDMFRDAPA